MEFYSMKDKWFLWSYELVYLWFGCMARLETFVLSCRDGLDVGEDMAKGAQGQMHFSLSSLHEPAHFSSLNE